MTEGVNKLREHYLSLNPGSKIASKPSSILVGPVLMDRWPAWAKALKQFSKSEDKGVGDVVARTIGNEKSEAFKAWHKKTFGKDCNCTARRELWNLRYPL